MKKPSSSSVRKSKGPVDDEEWHEVDHHHGGSASKLVGKRVENKVSTKRAFQLFDCCAAALGGLCPVAPHAGASCPTAVCWSPLLDKAA